MSDLSSDTFCLRKARLSTFVIDTSGPSSASTSDASSRAMSPETFSPLGPCPSSTKKRPSDGSPAKHASPPKPSWFAFHRPGSNPTIETEATPSTGSCVVGPADALAEPSFASSANKMSASLAPAPSSAAAATETLPLCSDGVC